MKKNKKNIISSVMIIGLLTLLILFVTGLFTLTGSTPLSLSEVQFDTTGGNGLFNGDAWVYTFRIGGLSAQMYGTVTPEQAGNLNQGDEIPEKSFSMQTDVLGQECMYDIGLSQGGTGTIPVYDWSIAQEGVFDSHSCDDNLIHSTEMCGDKLAINAIVLSNTQQHVLDPSAHIISTDTSLCTAICGDKIGEVSTFNSPDYNANILISTHITGQSQETKEFNTLTGVIRDYVGSYAYVIWDGNFVSGKSCPNADVIARPIFTSTGWHSISNDWYDHYVNAYDTVSNSVSGGFDQFVADYNRLVDTSVSIMSHLDSVDYGKDYVEVDRVTWKNKNELTSGKLVLDVDSLQLPVLTVYIDADKINGIGFHIPTGKPEIMSTSTSCFTSSSTGQIDVNVKNVGDEGEEFQVYAECPNPFITGNDVGYVSAGDSYTFKIQLSANVVTKIESDCTVYVKSREYTDSKVVGVCVDNVKLCTPDSMSCSQEGNINKCNSDGLWEFDKSCDYGCSYDGGVPVCNVNNSGGGSNTSGGFSSVLFWVTLIVSIIGGIIIANNTKMFASSISKNHAGLVSTIIFFVVALIIFFLLPLIIKGVISMFTFPSIHFFP